MTSAVRNAGAGEPARLDAGAGIGDDARDWALAAFVAADGRLGSAERIGRGLLGREAAAGPPGVARVWVHGVLRFPDGTKEVFWGNKGLMVMGAPTRMGVPPLGFVSPGFSPGLVPGVDGGLGRAGAGPARDEDGLAAGVP